MDASPELSLGAADNAAASNVPARPALTPLAMVGHSWRELVEQAVLDAKMQRFTISAREFRRS